MTKTETVDFSYHRLEIPVVQFFVNGFRRYAIIDTGANQTIFSTEWVQSYPRDFSIAETDSGILVGFNGKQETEAAEFTAELEFQSMTQPLPVTGLAVSTGHINEYCGVSVSAIIGSDTLNRYKSVINYKNKTITFSYDLSCERED